MADIKSNTDVQDFLGEADPNYDSDKDFKDAMGSLKLDEKELENKSKVAVKNKKNITDGVLSVDDIASNYKYVLEGKSLNEEKTHYVQTGKAIAGSNFIRLSYGVLSSFAAQANLVSSKDLDTFNIQFKDAFRKVNTMALRDNTLNERNQRLIIKMFKDAMKNVGDIITNNQDNMRNVFSGYEDESQPDRGFGEGKF